VKTDGEIGRALRGAAQRDGGFGPGPGGASEPEPTALAAIALGDSGAAAWLAAHQGADGSVGMRLGAVWNDSATALAAFVLTGSDRERALDHVAGAQGRTTPDSPIVPHDGALRGWAWTEGTAGWVEPTARGVLALRALRPTAPEIVDGVGYLGDRACAGGGWNYGNRAVYGEDLPPYAQTTAAAMLALRPGDGAVFEQGLAALRALWSKERLGGLSVAMTLAAATAHGDAIASEVSTAMESLFDESGFLGDTVALAWAAIASGPGLDRLMGGGA
jgi:hypothetical protein